MIITEIDGQEGNCIELIKVQGEDESLSSELCNATLPENRDSGYTITSIQNEKVILAEGVSSLTNDFMFAIVFEGNLNEHDDNVIWTKLPSMKKARADHAAFNLENKLYIKGGVDHCGKCLDSSEVFDVAKNIWSDGPHLPFALWYPKAVTNRIHSFSIVIGEKTTKLSVLIFQYELGFKEIISTNISTVNFCLTEQVMD